MRNPRRSRLVVTNYGHVGYVGKCSCLICDESMRYPMGCLLTGTDRILVFRFISRTRNWKKDMLSIREMGNPSNPEETAIYQFVNTIGPSRLLRTKLTKTVVDLVLKREYSTTPESA